MNGFDFEFEAAPVENVTGVQFVVEDVIVITGTVVSNPIWPTYMDYNLQFEDNYSGNFIDSIGGWEGFVISDTTDSSTDGNTPEEEAEEQGIDLKDGVEIDEMSDAMQNILDDIATAWANNASDITPVITSGNEGNDGDGVHSTGSLHYSGDAVDMRTNNLTQSQTDAIVTELQQSLGDDYDVIDEGDHIHIEYDPAG